MRFNYWQKFYEGNYYHVYNRANNRESLFVRNSHYSFFLEKWVTYLDPYLETYAYCLMWNHFHFIVRVKTVDDTLKAHIANEKTAASQKFLNGETLISAFVEDQFKRLFTSYSSAFNLSENRRGSLFQKRFKRVQIDNEVALLNKICYVHHNPIHHGINPCYDDWRYSSYESYLSDKPTKIARIRGLLLFHSILGSVAAFVKYHLVYQKERMGLKADDDMDIDLTA